MCIALLEYEKAISHAMLSLTYMATPPVSRPCLLFFFHIESNCIRMYIYILILLSWCMCPRNVYPGYCKNYWCNKAYISSYRFSAN